TTIQSEVLVIKELALYTGISLAAIGTSMQVIGAVVGRWLRMSQRAAAAGNGDSLVRRLLGGLAGIVVGALGGVAVGHVLARPEAPPMERLGGSVVMGAFVGAALGRGRTWLIVLGCALVGYFVGMQLSFPEISFEAVGLPALPMGTAAALGFAIVGG